MEKEVFFDLDTNKKLEGNFLGCNVELCKSVFALMNSGYTVIDCNLPDQNNIYLNRQDLSVETKNNTVKVSDVIQEGKDNNEYRRITYKDSRIIKYDSFSANDVIEIKILGNYDFSNVPEGFRIISIYNYTVIRIKIKTIEYVDNMYGYSRTLKKLDVYSAIRKLESWIEELTDKKVEQISIKGNEYGNSKVAIDCNKKQIINGNYILLDSLMVPIISELREKGYQTLGCCSGHSDSVFIQNTSLVPEEQIVPKKVESWIVFSNKFPIPTPPEDAECSEVSQYYRISYSHNIVNTDGTYKTTSVIKQEIEESINKLLEWAKSLPYTNSVKHSL